MSLPKEAMTNWHTKGLSTSYALERLKLPLCTYYKDSSSDTNKMLTGTEKEALFFTTSRN